MSERCHEKKVVHGIMAVIIGLIIATAISLVLGVFVMLLWNWLMPAIFGLGTISYWQAFGLSLLSKLLLCGFARFAPWQRKNGRWRSEGLRGRFARMRHFDDAYEDWWEKEGSESFESYMKKENESKTE